MRASMLGRVSAGVLFLAACGGGSPSGSGISGPGPTYNDISGNYLAPVDATTAGLEFTGTMHMYLSQTDDTFSGSYTMVGMLVQGSDSSSVTLVGAVANGSLESGADPLLQLELQPTGCALISPRSTGSYDSSTQILTLSPAVIPIQDLNCSGLIGTATDTLDFALEPALGPASVPLRSM